MSDPNTNTADRSHLADSTEVPEEDRATSATDPSFETPSSETTDTPSDRAESSSAEEGGTSGKKKKHFHLQKRTVFFGTVAIIAIIIYSIANADSLVQVYSRVGDILAPVIIGGVIAYLCNPIMRFYEYVVFRKMRKSEFRRGICLFMTVATVIAFFAAILALIIPELINSIKQLINNLDSYLQTILTAVQGIIDKIPMLEIDVSNKEALIQFIEDTFGSVEDALAKASEALQKFINIGTVGNIVGGVVNIVKNIFLGIFIAFYILSSKEKRSAQIRKARAALLNEKQDKKLTEITLLVDKTFGGFIKGLLLDALAVGAVTFLMLTIFGVSEYNLLIAVICGITNIIPVFGPFIGAIPSALIVLISNPSKLLVFVILILVIQQIDGNILVPRIQGSNTGISSLAVLIAITVMGSVFGLMGMVIGVPVFAVIIEMVKRALEERLVKRGAPTDTIEYYPADAVGNAEEDIYYEHSHLRYRYEHSKLKVRVDRIRAAQHRAREKRAEARRRRHEAKAARNPEVARNRTTNPTGSSQQGKSGKKKKKK